MSSIPQPRLELLRADHAAAVLAFERRNRDYFARTVPDRGDDFFTHFADRHAQLLEYQAAGTDRMHVLVDTDGEVLGRFNLVEIADGAAELGFRVARSAAGRGLATATVARLIDLAATDYRLTVLRARTTVSNPASRTVLERNGFVLVDDIDIDGAPAWAFRLELTEG